MWKISLRKITRWIRRRGYFVLGTSPGIVLLENFPPVSQADTQLREICKARLKNILTFRKIEQDPRLSRYFDAARNQLGTPSLSSRPRICSADQEVCPKRTFDSAERISRCREFPWRRCKAFAASMIDYRSVGRNGTRDIEKNSGTNLILVSPSRCRASASSIIVLR